MDKITQVQGSDGITYEVTIRGHLYVVMRDGDVFLTGSVPTVVNRGATDEQAALEFARGDIEKKIKAAKK